MRIDICCRASYDSWYQAIEANGGSWNHSIWKFHGSLANFSETSSFLHKFIRPYQKARANRHMIDKYEGLAWAILFGSLDNAGMRVGTCLFVSWHRCVPGPLLWIKSFTPSCNDFKVTYYSGHHLWTSPSWCRATLLLKLRRSQRIKRARQPFHHQQRGSTHTYVTAHVLRFRRGADCRMESGRRKSSGKLKVEVVSLQIVMLVDWLLTLWSW